MRCLTGARFNMKADVLRQSDNPKSVVDPTSSGVWVDRQDPLSGEIVRIWEPVTTDDPATPDVEVKTIKCMVRGIIGGGVRAAGTTESFDKDYQNIEFVRMTFPTNYVITKRDRITNIRNSKKQIVWKEEENPQLGLYRATVFDVLGVTPVLDPFGLVVENIALMERAEIQ